MNSLTSGGGSEADSVLNQVLQGIKFGLRSLMRRPGFAFVAIVTIGIGANAAIFRILLTVESRFDEISEWFRSFRASGLSHSDYWQKLDNDNGAAAMRRELDSKGCREKRWRGLILSCLHV